MTFDAVKRSFATRAPRRSDRWGEAGVEPRLSDLLADPMIHQVMRRDGLKRADLEAAVAHGRAQLRRRLCSRCAA